MSKKPPKKLETLSLNLKVMKILTLWPDNNVISKKIFIKHALFIISFCPAIVALILGLFYLDNIIGILDDIIGTTAIVAMEYMCQCFLRGLKDIDHLIKEINNFKKYNAEDVIQKTEVKIRKYTKGMFLNYYVYIKIDLPNNLHHGNYRKSRKHH